MLKIYCDTSVLPNNIRGPQQAERDAMKKLIEAHRVAKCILQRSRVVRREVDETNKLPQRQKLKRDHDALENIAKDERVKGFTHTSDRLGGFATVPIVSDKQDDDLYAKLVAHGLSPKDAEHVTQAICNDCDLFLTCDKKTIINPHRHWIEKTYPIRVRLPSEVVSELGL
jgi:predicted nucleic acid-binding protein